jgi:poly(3-hydroxybutyrate) depolymerase
MRAKYLAAGMFLAFLAAAPNPPAADTPKTGTQHPEKFEKKITTTVKLSYLLYLPQGYGTEPEKKWPLIVFLHGSGERGNDLNVL